MTSWDTPTYAPPHDGWCSLSTSPVCVVPNASRCGPLGELCPDMVLVQIGIDMMTVVSFVCFLVCCVRAACRVRTETRGVTATLREPVLRQDSAADVEAAEGAGDATWYDVLDESKDKREAPPSDSPPSYRHVVSKEGGAVASE